MKILILLFSCLWFLSENAYACSCLRIDDEAKYINGIGYIIDGTVLGVTRKSSSWFSWIYFYDYYEVTIDAHQMVKGSFKDPIKVYTSTNSASCGKSFDVGKRYLIFAFRTSEVYRENGMSPEGVPYVSSCGFTHEFDGNSEDISEILGILEENR
jgi:hypothetical protein